MTGDRGRDAAGARANGLRSTAGPCKDRALPVAERGAGPL